VPQATPAQQRRLLAAPVAPGLPLLAADQPVAPARVRTDSELWVTPLVLTMFFAKPAKAVAGFWQALWPMVIRKTGLSGTLMVIMVCEVLCGKTRTHWVPSLLPAGPLTLTLRALRGIGSLPPK